MDKIRCLLGNRRMERVPIAQIRELCEVAKGVDKRIEDSVLQWLGHMERMGKDRIAKTVYA